MHRIRFRRISEARILAGDQTGRKWEVMVIKAGLSHNLCPEGCRYFYDAAMLKEATLLFKSSPLRFFDSAFLVLGL